ncbi:YdhK family protein [Bacillus sp. JJ722]|uniref:YdhK family protein n=1 Tax=Bacillus sp. JJ722 TaxID=3122973 RepID=UPI002FFEB0C2
MKSSIIKIGLVSILSVFMLVACGDNNDDKNNAKEHVNPTENTDNNNNHEDMNHDESGDIPDELKQAENPKYKVGSKVVINTDHMEGMNGAEGIVVGAYDTTVYSITYTPKTGGEPVKNHKWVIQEEIENAGNNKVEPGTEVTLDAEHMKGMEDAKAVIDTAKETTVYMVDYKPTTGGDEVKNHKWVTEDELSAK